MATQAERCAQASFRLQLRTLMVPNVAERDRKRGKKRIFVPRSSRLAVKEGSKYPSIMDAKAMPLSYQSMDNTSLVTLAHLSDHDACREMLKRHIMDVDSCSYEEASLKFKEISKKNLEGAWLLSVPYKLGITAALVAGFGSIPMVFDLGTAQWFNEYYVTTDVPGKERIICCPWSGQTLNRFCCIKRHFRLPCSMSPAAQPRFASRGLVLSASTKLGYFLTSICAVPLSAACFSGPDCLFFFYLLLMRNRPQGY
jgi:hypothetical protein